MLFKPFMLNSLRSEPMYLPPHMGTFAALNYLNQMGNVRCTGLGDQKPLAYSWFC